MLYEYECVHGHRFERVLPVSKYDAPQTCECGAASRKILGVSMVVVQKDICYDSPIDGRPITSARARREDLRKNNCVEYDPEMRKDYDKRVERDQEKLDKAMERTVEATIEKMPIRKRERLANALSGGADVTPQRQAAPFKSITKVKHGH